ncbi:MAG: tRNA (guanosine(46)-N7)-methyltransferase TrmB [Treponema sp.]|jgi:tRNA (guanine-N7-)-methyltransferase|nr:tRNA (guanosine(46)-N7)-methyltransferase TrmB [Treponema sp.]
MDHIKSYVLRAGRMTDAQRRSYDSLAAEFMLPYAEAPADLSAVFGSANPVTVEIGFGMGIATAAIAAAHPAKNYLGIEVHRPGIGRLLWEIETQKLANIKIIEHDAAEVFQRMIPPASLEAIHIFFPDPWPKKRHHKRRLVTRPFTETLARALKNGGYLYMVSDWEDYCLWALEELTQTDGLVNQYEVFAPPQQWRPRTKFEHKGLAKNHQVRELFFIRKQP